MAQDNSSSLNVAQANQKVRLLRFKVFSHIRINMYWWKPYGTYGILPPTDLPPSCLLQHL